MINDNKEERPRHGLLVIETPPGSLRMMSDSAGTTLYFQCRVHGAAGISFACPTDAMRAVLAGEVVRVPLQAVVPPEEMRITGGNDPRSSGGRRRPMIDLDVGRERSARNGGAS